MGKTYKSLKGLREDLGLPEVKDKQQSSTKKNNGKADSLSKSSKKGKKKKTPKKGTAAEAAALKKKAQREAYEARKPVKLPYAIECPKHGKLLYKGNEVSIPIPGEADEETMIFYCYDCRQYYFSTTRIELGKIGKFNSKAAKNIQTPLYKREGKEWIHIRDITPVHKPKKVSVKKKDEAAFDTESEEEKLKKQEQARQKALMEEKRVREVRDRFDPKSDTLYIHKGRIKCLQDKHDVISVTLYVPTDLDGVEGRVNANYCFDCDKFFLSYDEYKAYLKRSQIMLVKLQFEESTSDAYGDKWAEKSPLMLSGYSVSAAKGFSDEKRKRILKKIIDNGIVDKPDVIEYIHFFIKTKQGQEQNKSAIEKWKRDLEYVRNYSIDEQKEKKISTIKQHGRK